MHCNVTLSIDSAHDSLCFFSLHCELENNSSNTFFSLSGDTEAHKTEGVKTDTIFYSSWFRNVFIIFCILFLFFLLYTRYNLIKSVSKCIFLLRTTTQFQHVSTSYFKVLKKFCLRYNIGGKIRMILYKLLFFMFLVNE